MATFFVTVLGWFRGTAIVKKLMYLHTSPLLYRSSFRFDVFFSSVSFIRPSPCRYFIFSEVDTSLFRENCVFSVLGGGFWGGRGPLGGSVFP